MTTRDYTANVISASKVVPDGNFKDSKASGVWDINEALDLIKGGNWPNAANINPSAFVDALFSTFLYDGTGSNLEINNGINLSGSGGLVWVKRRNGGDGHWLVDTERGLNNSLQSHSTAVGNTNSDQIVSFDSDGFTLGNRNEGQNYSGLPYVSWTFRKQPKFFDIVTYTGDGNADRQINHNLGSTPGMMLVKKYAGSTTRWSVYHRYLGTGKFLNLDDTASTVTQNDHWQTAPNATQFTVETNGNVNNSGDSYVAYLFAHNNNDGGFGEPGDQDIIKCDSYTGNGSSTGPVINLGFEPQWIIVKGASQSSNWTIIDNMRGLVKGANAELMANLTNSEGSVDYFDPQATGFQLTQATYYPNSDGETYIYMAIRRGGMQTPTAASDVFAVDTMANQTPAFDSTFPVDMVIRRNVGGVNTNTVWARITGSSYLNTNATAAASNDAEAFDSNVGFGDGSTYSDNHAYMWARARGYFDAVAYSGTGSGAQNVSHNLGVVPEMMWIKVRSDGDNWTVYHSALGNTKRLLLNSSGEVSGANEIYFNDTTPTSSVFTVAAIANGSHTYIAYLFATVANVSKVGSFTQSGATNVACGFTGSTPALIILKRTDAAGDWYLFDSLRGIVAGNDPYFILNDTTAPTTNADMVDPYSGGFATTSNIADGDYIFYAIASIA